MLMAATRARLAHRSLKDPHAAGTKELPQIAVQINAFLLTLSAQHLRQERQLKP